MLKKLLLTIFLGIFTLTAAAFDVRVIPSLTVNLFDQVKYVPHSLGLNVGMVKSVVCGQPFNIYFSLALKNPTERDLKLNGELVLIKADGSREKITEKLFFDVKKGQKGVFISPVSYVMIFEKGDKTGTYFFELTLAEKDNPAGKHTFSAAVALADKMPEAPLKLTKNEFDQLLSRYYLNPQPEKLLPALRYFLEDGIDLMQKKKGKSFDPRHILHGFSAALKLNPQLWRNLAEMTKNSPEKNHLYYALIFAGLGKDAVLQNKEIIAPLVQVQIGQFAGKNPLDFKESTHPAHLDMLWMEFFITGKYAPVEKIARELRKRDVLTLKEAKKIRESKRAFTEEEKLKLRNFMMSLSAHWSLRSNIRQGNPLIGFYLLGMVQRKVCADAHAEALVVNILKSINKKNNNKQQNPPPVPAGKE